MRRARTPERSTRAQGPLEPKARNHRAADTDASFAIRRPSPAPSRRPAGRPSDPSPALPAVPEARCQELWACYSARRKRQAQPKRQQRDERRGQEARTHLAPVVPRDGGDDRPRLEQVLEHEAQTVSARCSPTRASQCSTPSSLTRCRQAAGGGACFEKIYQATLSLVEGECGLHDRLESAGLTLIARDRDLVPPEFDLARREYESIYDALIARGGHTGRRAPSGYGS